MEQRKRLTILLTMLVLVSIAFYGVFNSRQFFAGPQIIVTEPTSGSSFDNPSIVVRGKAHNTAFIKLNGNPIYINEHNEFNEKLLLSPGTSIMKLEATDRFERSVEKTLLYTYTGNPIRIATTTLPLGTSTVDTTF